MQTFIHHDGALGDVLLSLPCLRTMRREGECIHLAARADVGRLLREAALVDEVSAVSDARYASLYAGALNEQARTFLTRFERSCVFTARTEGPVAAALGSVVPDVKVIITVPPPGAAVHASEFRLGQCRGDGLLPGEPFLPVPPRFRNLADAMLARLGYDGSRPLVAIHPGSGGKAKNWAWERYVALVEALQRPVDPFVLLITGPAEDDGLKDAAEDFSRSRQGAVHVSDVELIAVAALLSRCDLMIGNDSGISHLAAAAGAPVLALFGPTDPVLWRPSGAAVERVAASALEEITVAMVYERVMDMLRRRGSAKRKDE